MLSVPLRASVMATSEASRCMPDRVFYEVARDFSERFLRR